MTSIDLKGHARTKGQDTFNKAEGRIKMEQASEITKIEKTPKYMHLIAGWPFVLVLFGGLIGGGLGGLAYLINLKIYNSQLSKINKILANMMCGMVAISAWWLIAGAVQNTFFNS